MGKKDILHVPFSSFKRKETATSGNGGGSAISPDGILSGLSITNDGFDIAVTAGTWRINNQVYSCSDVDLTLSDADPVDGRIDLIYADAHNSVLVLEGTPSANPVKPSLPGSCIEVGFALVSISGVDVTGSALADYLTISAFNDQVGSKSDLQTNDKNSVVSGVNEVKRSLDALNQDNIILKIFKKTNYS